MKKVNSSLKYLLSFGQKYKIWMVVCIFFSLLDVAVSMLIPIVYEHLVDMISASNDTDKFYTYICFIVILLFGGTVNIFIRKISASRFAQYTVRNLRNKIAEHIQNFSFSSFKKHHSGDLASRVNNDMDLIEKFLIEISNFLYQPLVFICAMVYGLILSWKLLLVTILVLFIAICLNNFASKPISKFSRKLQEQFGKSNSIIQDTISGIYIVKSFNLQKKLQNNYQLCQEYAYDTELKIVKRRLRTIILSTSVLMIPMIAINLYGGRLTFIGEMTIGKFTAFLAIITYLTNPVIEVIALVADVKITRAGAERIYEILSYPTEENLEDKDAFEIKDNIPVEFNNVSFSYDGHNSVLYDINFKLLKNKKVALVGASGAGKSTIINLLCGFYKATEGEINIFGNKLNEIDLKALRSQISMVTQNSYIYPTTVAENIGYANKNSTRDEIIYAAKMANAHEFIMELPKGYDTILMENGSNLSGGQKQRITIARAILKDSPILILDEPTSALDSHNEKAIGHALSVLVKDKSIIIVAHRFSTIRDADEILVLDNGRIVERGTHDELMELDGGYKKLYLKQYEENQSDNGFKGEAYNV